MEIQWALVIFTLLTGAGAGIFAFITLAELLGKIKKLREKGALLAIGLILVGGIASVFHLAHPTRAVSVLGNLGTSIGKEFILIGIVVVFLVAYIAAVKKESSSTKGLAAFGFVFSVLLAFEIGATYVLPGQPAWNTYLLPLVYLASASVLGIFGIYVLVSNKDSEEEKVLVGEVNKLAFAAIIIEAVLVFAYAAHLDTTAYVEASMLTASSPGFTIFWLGVVAIGLVIPFALTFWFLRSKSNALNVAAISLICTVIGGIAFRALMYTLGTGIHLSL